MGAFSQNEFERFKTLHQDEYGDAIEACKPYLLARKSWKFWAAEPLAEIDSNDFQQVVNLSITTQDPLTRRKLWQSFSATEISEDTRRLFFKDTFKSLTGKGLLSPAPVALSPTEKESKTECLDELMNLLAKTEILRGWFEAEIMARAFPQEVASAQPLQEKEDKYHQVSSIEESYLGMVKDYVSNLQNNNPFVKAIYDRRGYFSNEVVAIVVAKDETLRESITSESLNPIVKRANWFWNGAKRTLANAVGWATRGKISPPWGYKESLITAVRNAVANASKPKADDEIAGFPEQGGGSEAFVATILADSESIIRSGKAPAAEPVSQATAALKSDNLVDKPGVRAHAHVGSLLKADEAQVPPCALVKVTEEAKIAENEPTTLVDKPGVRAHAHVESFLKADEAQVPPCALVKVTEEAKIAEAWAMIYAAKEILRPHDRQSILNDGNSSIDGTVLVTSQLGSDKAPEEMLSAEGTAQEAGDSEPTRPNGRRPRLTAGNIAALQRSLSKSLSASSHDNSLVDPHECDPNFTDFEGDAQTPKSSIASFEDERNSLKPNSLADSSNSNSNSLAEYSEPNSLAASSNSLAASFERTNRVGEVNNGTAHSVFFATEGSSPDERKAPQGSHRRSLSA